MVMGMMFGAAGISSAGFLIPFKVNFTMATSRKQTSNSTGKGYVQGNGGADCARQPQK